MPAALNQVKNGCMAVMSQHAFAVSCCQKMWHHNLPSEMKMASTMRLSLCRQPVMPAPPALPATASMTLKNSNNNVNDANNACKSHNSTCPWLSLDRCLAPSLPHTERFSDQDYPLNVSAAPLHIVSFAPCPEAWAFAFSPWPWGIITSTHFMIKSISKFCYLEHKPRAAVTHLPVVWETPVSRLSWATVCTGPGVTFLQIVHHAWMVTALVGWPGHGIGVRSPLVLHFNLRFWAWRSLRSMMWAMPSLLTWERVNALDCGISDTHEDSPG